MGAGRTPEELREGVRSAIADALEHDTALRGGRTARLLAAAGALGIFGALGVIRMIAGHPIAHHPAWHLVVFGAVWSGLLVVALAITFLQVRTPSLPLARSARIGLVGLGIAGICSALCPDQHFLDWWSSTSPGSAVRAIAGLPLSASCFGLVATFVFGTAAAFLGAGTSHGRSIRALLPAAMLLLLLAPGVALQSFGTSWGVFAGWLLGTSAGAYAGAAAGIRARALLTHTPVFT